MKDHLQFGIVGCGMIARYHAVAIRQTDRCSLLGACSKTYASTETFSQEVGCTPFASYEEMLAQPELDVVVICSSSGEHFRQAKEALEAGKHVIVEKPMCLTMADADALVELDKQYPQTVCVISQSRFSDAAQAIKAAIDAGSFGKMVSASLMMRYFRSQAYYDQAAWRGTVAGDGGGVLMNQGIHGIDLLCHFMGKPVGVTGYARTMLRDIEVEDTAAAAIEFESGAIATLDATVCSQPSFSKKFILCGEKGTVVMEEDAILSWSLPEPCPIPLGAKSGNSASADPKGISVAYHLREYEDFVGHVLDGKKLMLDADQGRMPLGVILGVYESSRTGKHIKLS